MSSEERDEELDIAKDQAAILEIQNHRGGQALVRHCESRMREKEDDIFSEAAMTYEGYLSSTREWRAYREMRDLILNTPEDEETEDA